MKHIVSYIIVLFSMNLIAQQSLSLDECYKLVAVNYPLAKQHDLLEKQSTIDLDIINTEKLPKLDFLAQATYQSDVIEIPIPSAGIEPINKDQYRTTLSVNQLIYGGGSIDASLKARVTALKTQQKQIDVNLYQLKKQVNQLYFSVLLLQEKRNLLLSKKEQLETKLSEVRSGIENGVILPTSDRILEVELLKIGQQFSDISLSRKSLLETLSTLIGQDIDSTIVLQNPEVSTRLKTEIYRPELVLFKLKKEEIEASQQLISKQNAPKLLGFATGGYGNPGLDMLDNSFQAFYTVGVKLNWNVFDWNANKKKRASLAINKAVINSEIEIFELNTSIELNQQQLEIEKLSQFIASDLDIIQLRKEVLKATDSQLRNGVITASVYITELTNLYEDKNNLDVHKIQLLLAKANYNVTKGY